VFGFSQSLDWQIYLLRQDSGIQRVACGLFYDVLHAQSAGVPVLEISSERSAAGGAYHSRKTVGGNESVK